MGVQTYDADQVSINVGPFTLSEFAPDSFVTITMTSEAWTMQIGATGAAARSKTNDRSATISIKLMQTSDSNDLLDGFRKSDELANAGIFPLLIKDNSGRSLYAAETAWVQKMPDSEFARDATAREWIIATDNLVATVGGSE